MRDKNIKRTAFLEDLNRLKPARKVIEQAFHKSLGKNVYTNIKRTAFLGDLNRLKPARKTIELPFYKSLGKNVYNIKRTAFLGE